MKVETFIRNTMESFNLFVHYFLQKEDNTLLNNLIQYEKFIAFDKPICFDRFYGL
jgi:hypothetical protein